MAIYKEDLVDIELSTGVIHRAMLAKTIGYADTNADRFGVRVFRNGEPVDLTGVTCSGYFITAGGVTIALTNGAIGNNEAYVTLTSACYAEEGTFSLAIKLSGGGLTGTVRIVDGVVSRTETDVTIDPGTIIPNIETLIAELDDILARIPSDYSTMGKEFAFINPTSWEQLSTYAIRTNKIDVRDIAGLVMYAPPGYCYRYYTWDENQDAIGNDGDFTGTYLWTKANKAICYISVNLYRANKTDDIDISEGIVLSLRNVNGPDSIYEYVFTRWVSSLPVQLQNVYGIKAWPGNLVIASECVNNRYVNANNGNLVSDSGYFCTGWLPVTAGHTYRANIGRNYAWYDSSKTYISGATGTGIKSGITAPTGAAFLRFTINKSTDQTSEPMDIYCAGSTVYDVGVEIANLRIPENSVKPWCYGKTINWMGDSIVAGQDFDEEVCYALGLNANDYGINSSTIALNGSGQDTQNAMCVRYAQMDANADIIVVSGGTNDFQYTHSPIGTIDDPDDGTSNNTFYGALKTLCKGLIDRYPTKLILFTTPIKRAQPFDGTSTKTTPFSRNGNGKTLMEYADIIKEVCGYYSIPVLDMNRESLLNPHLASQEDMFDDVYTHPNELARKIMARRVAAYINSLAYTISGL